MIKWKKNVISCIVVLLLTVCVLGNLTKLMERKNTVQKYADFFDEKQDFDVLFMGTSKVINAVFPMELWNDYGIISYNFGGHSNRVPTSYWVMMNALDYTNPKLIVMDGYWVDNYKMSQGFSYVHSALDEFPISVNKIKAVWDLFDDSMRNSDIENGVLEEKEKGTKFELLWDYSLYHTRWEEIGSSDFVPEIQPEKGAESRINVAYFEGVTPIDSNLKYEEDNYATEYMCKIIEECQARNIEVLLTFMPCPADEEQQKQANRIQKIADQYGVKYINFLNEDVINYKTDCYDEVHMNPSGARKITNYLCQYILDNYDIQNHRNDPVYSDWEDDYITYTDMKNRNLKSQENIYNYLMLLSDDKFKIIIDVKDTDIFYNICISELIRNLGVDIDKLSDQTDFIIIDNEDSIVINDFRDDGAFISSNLGEICLRYDIEGVYHDGELGYYGLYIGEDEILEGNTNEPAGLQIVVFREDTMIDAVKFVYAIDPDTYDVNVSVVNR